MGKFFVQELSTDGLEIGDRVAVSTPTGVLMYAPEGMTLQRVEHVCAMARENPGYPYDLALFDGPEDARFICWSARLTYEE